MLITHEVKLHVVSVQSDQDSKYGGIEALTQMAGISGKAKDLVISNFIKFYLALDTSSKNF